MFNNLNTGLQKVQFNHNLKIGLEQEAIDDTKHAPIQLGQFGAGAQEVSTGDLSKYVLDSPRTDTAQKQSVKHTYFSTLPQKTDESDLMLSPTN